MVEDALDIALLVAAAIEHVGGEYFVGGSVASSLQGEPRATNDIDFVVSMTRVRAFAEALAALDQGTRGHHPPQTALVPRRRRGLGKAVARHRGCAACCRARARCRVSRRLGNPPRHFRTPRPRSRGRSMTCSAQCPTTRRAQRSAGTPPTTGEVGADDV